MVWTLTCLRTLCSSLQDHMSDRRSRAASAALGEALGRWEVHSWGETLGGVRTGPSFLPSSPPGLGDVWKPQGDPWAGLSTQWARPPTPPSRKAPGGPCTGVCSHSGPLALVLEQRARGEECSSHAAGPAALCLWRPSGGPWPRGACPWPLCAALRPGCQLLGPQPSWLLEPLPAASSRRASCPALSVGRGWAVGEGAAPAATQVDDVVDHAAGEVLPGRLRLGGHQVPHGVAG